MTTGPHGHRADEPCEAGLELYARALREGSVPQQEADPVPCLIDSRLLQPDLEDTRQLRPVAPAIALPRLLHTTAEDIARQRQREARLAEAFAPLMRIDGRHTAVADTPTISILSGRQRINRAITEAMADANEELLAIQPRANYPAPHEMPRADAMDRDQALLDRGGRIRTLYQHTTRYLPSFLARYEQLRGDAEARTLDEVTDRLIVVDRAVAFIPANGDGTLALEIGHPALVEYFVTTFDRLWRLATPMYPEAVQRPSLAGITPRQRAIASLLIEGHTDAVIGDRLGMNVRTVRVHIAKLAEALGSESRAQLGYLIAQSGVLDQDR